MSALSREAIVPSPTTITSPLRLVPGGLPGRGNGVEKTSSRSDVGRQGAPAAVRQIMSLPKYVALLSAMLLSAMLGSLLIHTVMAQGAFEVQTVQKEMKVLRDRHEELTQIVAAAEAPVAVERRARQMGMVPAASPVFLRLADKTVLGNPVAAKR